MNKLTLYTLDVLHNGTDCGDVCIYQTYDGQMDDIRPLVWFNKTAHPGTRLHFEWNVEYSLAWSEQGDLTPGVVFQASQILSVAPADPSSNTLLLTRDRNAFRFGQTDNFTKAGKLGVVCDSTIPANTVSVGVAMSGKPAVACVASPNLKYTFMPHPRYWIAFGRFEEGEVIDVNRMTQKFEINYPVNVFSRTVELNTTNSWELK